MKRHLIVTTVIVALLLVAVTPVLAATTKWDLNIHNNTEDDVKLKLSGPEDYSFTVIPGKIYKTVEEGTYDYSYTACGEKFSGEITVKDDEQWLIIESCGETPIFAKFVVDSRIPSAITLHMVGPQSYDLAIDALANNKFLEIQAGDYVYSYDGCGGTYGGEIRVTKNGKARVDIPPCEIVDYLAGLDNTVDSSINLRIGSHYAFPVSVRLVGPTSYVYSVSLGLNRYKVFPGAYSYSYTAYGQYHSGSFVVDESGAWITIAP